MGCLGSHPFYLHAFNILKLSDLATTPFVHPGGAAYSLVISVICKESGRIECEYQKKMYQSGWFSLAFASSRTYCLWEHVLRLSQPFPYIICSHLGGIVRGKFENPRAHLIVCLPDIAHCMPKPHVLLMRTLISTERTYGM